MAEKINAVIQIATCTFVLGIWSLCPLQMICWSVPRKDNSSARAGSNAINPILISKPPIESACKKRSVKAAAASSCCLKICSMLKSCPKAKKSRLSGNSTRLFRSARRLIPGIAHIMIPIPKRKTCHFAPFSNPNHVKLSPFAHNRAHISGGNKNVPIVCRNCSHLRLSVV